MTARKRVRRGRTHRAGSELVALVVRQPAAVEALEAVPEVLLVLGPRLSAHLLLRLHGQAVYGSGANVEKLLRAVLRKAEIRELRRIAESVRGLPPLAPEVARAEFGRIARELEARHEQSRAWRALARRLPPRCFCSAPWRLEDGLALCTGGHVLALAGEVATR